jgi:hypothetical protein
MKQRVNKKQPLYRLNIYISREIANKVRSRAGLEDKTIERYVEDTLREKVTTNI